MAHWPPLPQNRVRGSQHQNQFTLSQRQQMRQAGLTYGSPVNQLQIASLQPKTSSKLQTYSYPYNYNYKNVQKKSQQQQQHYKNPSPYNYKKYQPQTQKYSQPNNNNQSAQYYNNTNKPVPNKNNNNYYGPKPSYGSVQPMSRGKQKTYDLAVETYETYETAADRDVLCWLFEDKGRCKWGETCQWLHLDRATGKYLPTVYLTSLATKRKKQSQMDAAKTVQVPHRSDVTYDRKNVCWEFNTYFGCKKGAKCAWSHQYLVKDATHPFTGETLDGMAVREFRRKMKRVV